MPASESELSNNDQVVSIEAGETNNAVTEFVGDNIYLNIVSIHGNTPFHPNGLNTIFTTLKECIRLAGFAIVTIDFPIRLKAVNIIVTRIYGLDLPTYSFS